MEDEKIISIFQYFESLFGKMPKCELDYASDIDLLVAIILSAQCTDKRVNTVTRTLFQKYRTIGDYADANTSELEKEIYSTGFYRNKSKNIIALCKILQKQFQGKIPDEVCVLEKLPGIGRKTASVFVAEFYNKPAIAVDTHVIRVSNRLGFTTSKNPYIIEKDLAGLWSPQNWGRYHLYMVLFGRYYCKAISPKCEDCAIYTHCNKNK
ncbi:MAG: endonuclease III [Firmicutes bacterium]|nr:endonuclease III [Bacillota bacterium]